MPGIRGGQRYALDSPIPGASKLTACTPRAASSRSNGAASSRLAPSPVIISSGGPDPRTAVRIRTPPAATNRPARPSGEGAGTRAGTAHNERLDRLGALGGWSHVVGDHVTYHGV